jgi:mercuric ion transport protein
MQTRTLLRTGVIGSLIAVICCATPVLVILLGAVGLSAWLGWQDDVPIPALVVFVGTTAYALYRRRCDAASCASGAAQETQP